MSRTLDMRRNKEYTKNVKNFCHFGGKTMRKKKELDEMEQTILVKSRMCAYKFMIIVLSLWVVIGLFLKFSIALPGYVLLGELFVQFATEQIYKRNMEDERWKHNSIVFVLVTVVTIFVAFFITVACIGTGEM